jgi:ADP-L-glycero-D-manno-heptose 6-epimerase
MIVVTGGAGFIGSAIVKGLNQRGEDDILIVDELGEDEKWKNLRKLEYEEYVDKEVFMDVIMDKGLDDIEAIIHMGACSDTQEKDAEYLMENNYEYTKNLALYCVEKKIRFLYASSAATYGDGKFGYKEENLGPLIPLNMYAYSKHRFDLWAERYRVADKITGIKYFNIFGPNEYHKDNMRSMINKGYHQIKETGTIELFKSDKKEYNDGEQKRDFLYIKDAVDMTLYLFENDETGIFNIGAGRAYTWNELAKALIRAMGQGEIKYIDMPDDIKDKYQYYTEADIRKIRDAGYSKEITSLKESVCDYVKNYLQIQDYL